MAQMQLSEAYKRDLLGQIQAHREATRAERQAYLEEGKRIRQEQLREKATLESVSILLGLAHVSQPAGWVWWAGTFMLCVSWLVRPQCA